MRLIAAKLAMPGRLVANVRQAYGAPRAKADRRQIAMDLLLPAVDQALQQAELHASQLDLIVSLSLSPDHLVSECEIMGPRIGHPLQKAIAAKNAFVFDLMDASLAKAIRIINTLAQQENYKNVLLVRSEMGHGVSPDSSSGFCLPDGAMALVLKPVVEQYFSQGLLEGGWSPLVVQLNTNIQSPLDEKCRFNFSYQEGLAKSIGRANDQLLSRTDLPANEGIFENWLSVSPGENACFGPFDLPREFVRRLEEGRYGGLLAVSFDPFGPVVETVSLELAAGGAYA